MDASADEVIRRLGEDPDDPIEPRTSPRQKYLVSPLPEPNDEREPDPWAMTMRDGHNARRCTSCVQYAIWVWPFTTMERWRSGKRDAEAEWLAAESDGYRIGPWEQGTFFAQNIVPDHGDLAHVVSTRPEGMSATEWVEAMDVIDAPTPWDSVPEGLAFWRDYAARWERRNAWVERNGGWDGPAWGDGWPDGRESVDAWAPRRA